MKHITFPKGSITIKKISKDPKAKPLPVLTADDFKSYKDKVKWTSLLGEKKITMTPEIEKAFLELNNNVKKTRSLIKQSDTTNEFNYEITFKSPKWHGLKFKHNALGEQTFGEIKVVIPRLNIREGYELIIKEFKARKNLARELKIHPTRHTSHTMINSLKWRIQYNKCAGVIHMPELKNGVYLQFLKDQEKRIVFRDKTPTEKATNYVGVELEFIANVNQEKLGFMLYDAGLGKYVKLTTDGSLRCTKHGRKHEHKECDCHKTEYPHELCVIMKETERKEILKKVCDVLSKVEARINKSCGLHIHLDMRNRTPEICYENLISAQNILYKMNPKSRQEKQDINPAPAAKLKERNFEYAMGADRHVGINASAYKKHRTIEVRIHSGTIEFRKIDNWINILLNVINTPVKQTKEFISLKGFCDAFDIHDDLKKYIEERINKFKPDIVNGMDAEAESGVA